MEREQILATATGFHGLSGPEPCSFPILVWEGRGEEQYPPGEASFPTLHTHPEQPEVKSSLGTK